MKTFIKWFGLGMLLLVAQPIIAQTTVTLKGKIVGRNSKRIIIIPYTGSLRSADKPTIKIENNTFEYQFTAKDVEAYQLVFEDEYEAGSWRPVVVFPDTSVIELVLNSAEKHDENIIIGGDLNKSYNAFMQKERERYAKIYAELAQKQTALIKANNYYSAAFEAIMADVRKTKSGIEAQPFYEKRNELEKMGLDLTPNGLQIKARYDSLSKAVSQWRYAIFKQNPSINNYFLMYLDVLYKARNDRYVATLIAENYQLYAKKFPEHLYTKVVGDGIGGIIKIVPGNQFVDFTAPDLKGQAHTLSTIIKDKVAIIDLWGSWCGPCIAKAQQIVPIYKKYKDKGFTVVGIAREFKSTNALKNRLKQEEFNWLNLVELDDKHGIWNKYSISNGAGIQVLVDAKGKILAVDPTAQEVEAILKKII